MDGRREAFALWPVVIAEARSRGYDRLYAAQDLSDRKLRLFLRLFGFVKEEFRNATHALMVQEI